MKVNPCKLIRPMYPALAALALCALAQSAEAQRTPGRYGPPYPKPQEKQGQKEAQAQAQKTPEAAPKPKAKPKREPQRTPGKKVIRPRESQVLPGEAVGPREGQRVGGAMKRVR